MASLTAFVDASQYAASLALLEYLNSDRDCFATLQEANGAEFDGRFAKLVIQSVNKERPARVIFDQAKDEMIRDLDIIIQ